MKLENQVCSLELAKKLKELGVKQESYLVWQVPPKVYADIDFTMLKRANDQPYYYEREHYKTYSAFTVAELGERLRPLLKDGQEYDKSTDFQGEFEHSVWNDTEADARAKMLIYLIENNLITV